MVSTQVVRDSEPQAGVPSDAGAADDAVLMVRYRDGDMRAFELLYARHKRGLYRYLQRMCGHPESANDLFQEVWSRVIASRERYEARAQFATFLYRIAHNCVVDHYRRTGRASESVAHSVEGTVENTPTPSHEQPEHAYSQAQVHAALRRALDALPAEQRDVFVLYEETGLGLEDIGRITGVAMETAKSRLRYALAKLRAGLSEYQPAGMRT